jgi:mRNA deadenylase 3'-5' endonuclease subunit Ccr4
MNKQIRIYVEYKIEESAIQQYHMLLDQIVKTLERFDAKHIECCKSEKQNQYMEIFTVPTESHFHAIKKIHKNKNHSIFGKLHEIVSGGSERILCRALVLNELS